MRDRFGYCKLDRIEKDARYRRLDNVGWGWNSFCFRGLQKEKVALGSPLGLGNCKELPGGCRYCILDRTAVLQ